MENLFDNQELFDQWSFPLFSLSQCFIQGWYCKEKLDAGHSKGQKVENGKQSRITVYFASFYD